MATRSLTLIAQVKDSMSAGLKRISNSLQQTGKQAKNTSANFTEFNKTIFSTTAFVGLFSMAMSKMYDSMVKASEMDRISEQFERVMGPKGNLFKAIDSMTKNSVDRMEAMKAGIALGTMGIVKDTNSLAELMARAGTAAKRSGNSSADGIKRVTDFLKDGSVAHLSFLNALSATNPALQLQMSILNKAGGVMGQVLSTQARLSMGMAALRAVTQGMHLDQEDLNDILFKSSEAFTFFRKELMLFVGNALSPVISKVTEFTRSATDMMERIRKVDTHLLTTIKNLFLVGSALTSVIATLGTARLIFKALGALGIGGIPLLAVSLLGLAAAFTDVQKASAAVTNTLKGMGAVLLGTFQLVSSFIHSADNFSKGIGKMDKGLHDFLSKNGLLNLTVNIARVSSVIIAFSRDVGNTLVNWFQKTAEFIDPLIKKMSEFFSASDPHGWVRSWIEGGKGIRGALVNITSGAIAAFGALKVLKMGSGLVGGLLSPGRLFGGKKGPTGTAFDPLFVKNLTSLSTLASAPSKAKELGVKGFSALTSGAFFVKLSTAATATSARLTNLMFTLGLVGQVVKTAILNPFTTLKSVFGILLPALRGFSSFLGTALVKFGKFNMIVAAIIAGAGILVGAYQGIKETWEEFSNFFQSIVNLGGAVYTVVDNFMKSNIVLKTIWNGLKAFGSFIINLPRTFFELVVESFKSLVGLLGVGAGILGNKINEISNRLNMGSSKDVTAQVESSGGWANAFGVPQAAMGPMSAQALDLAALGLKTTASGDNKVAYVPNMPDNTASQIAMVEKSMSMLAANDANVMQSSLQRALLDGNITKEEWYDIYKAALDDSKITKVTEEQTKKPTPPQHIKTQRC